MRFHDAAALEMAEAARWYESKSPGVGSRFLDEVERAVAMLQDSPRVGAVWNGTGLPENEEVRRFPLRMFPFLLVYTLRPEAIVIAVAHGSRRPGYWATRL